MSGLVLSMLLCYIYYNFIAPLQRIFHFKRVVFFVLDCHKFLRLLSLKTAEKLAERCFIDDCGFSLFSESL